MGRDGCAEEVGVVDCAVLGAQGGVGGRGGGDAGVVDELGGGLVDAVGGLFLGEQAYDVQPPELVLDRLDGLLDRRVVVDVDVQGLDVVCMDGHAGVGDEGVGGLLAFGVVPAAEEDVVGAGGGELLGGVVAQALVGAGDEGDEFVWGHGGRED